MNDFIPKHLSLPQKLDKILWCLDNLNKRMDQMAVLLSDLDAAIAAQNTKLTSLDSGMTALKSSTAQLVIDVAALAAKLLAGADYTAELNAVTAGSALVDNTTATLANAVIDVSGADTSAKG